MVDHGRDKKKVSFLCGERVFDPGQKLTVAALAALLSMLIISCHDFFFFLFADMGYCT